MRTDAIKLTLLVAIASVLAIATGVVYTSDSAPEPRGTSRGQVLFMGKGCGGCHTITGVSEGGIGPDLTFVREVAEGRVEGLTAEEYVRQSIREPQAFTVPVFEGRSEMPTLSMTDEDVETLTLFLLEER